MGVRIDKKRCRTMIAAIIIAINVTWCARDKARGAGWLVIKLLPRYYEVGKKHSLHSGMRTRISELSLALQTTSRPVSLDYSSPTLLVDNEPIIARFW